MDALFFAPKNGGQSGKYSYSNKWGADGMKLILASLSPRRQELLRQVGVKFEVVPSDFEELGASSLAPVDYVKENACGKALAVARKVHADDVVLAADTIVVLDGAILGKPGDEKEAACMLAKLSGRTHEVFTGMAVAFRGRIFTRVEKTDVMMRLLTTREIAVYAATGEPLDKAGAYGIQGKGALLVERIEGCYYNVVGLPLVALLKLFGEAGVRFEY